ncbi:Uncharacterized protein OBRU01_20929 [Operophtera brumata]|uniref:Uncharacterized protein n=1 Tax=Operophtera brumata TaxID=104452 RepID=A0A0L7KUD3_OPEBR|nr:Uncharacterized protein OBRU01_20929 [Operophtera brumata]
MQRLTCSYVQLANENVITGNATDFDATLSSLSRRCRLAGSRTPTVRRSILNASSTRRLWSKCYHSSCRPDCDIVGSS